MRPQGHMLLTGGLWGDSKHIPLGITLTLDFARLINRIHDKREEH